MPIPEYTKTPLWHVGDCEICGEPVYVASDSWIENDSLLIEVEGTCEHVPRLVAKIVTDD